MRLLKSQNMIQESTTASNLGDHLGDFHENKPPELEPYWPSRIEQDRTWYSHYVEPDERFYSPHQDHVYRITNLRDSKTVFTLKACASATDLSEGFNSPSDPAHQINNICAIAGAIEAGDLIHLEEGTIRSIGETTYITVGELTISLNGRKPEPDPLLEDLNPPNGPRATDAAKLAPIFDVLDGDATLYAPQAITTDASATPHPEAAWSSRAAQDVQTHFVPVSPFSKWTFEDDTIRSWVESKFEPGETILNACCGKTKLTPPPNGEILRNDINPERDADFHVDVAELAGLDCLEAESIDRIIFDPPWSVYQANLRYEENHVHVSKEGTHEIDLNALPFETPGPNEKTQIGHAKIAKEGFDWLLKPGGEIIELTFHGTSMPQRLEYDRKERVVFDPVGEARAVIGSVDQKTRQKLTDFF